MILPQSDNENRTEQGRRHKTVGRVSMFLECNIGKSALKKLHDIITRIVQKGEFDAWRGSSDMGR